MDAINSGKEVVGAHDGKVQYYSAQALPTFSHKPNSTKDGLHYYGVRILTGTSFKFSLYDIHITLVGDKATLSGHDRHTHFGKKYSWHDDLLMESDEDLGQVEVVTLKNKNLMRMQQHIQFVEVHDFNRGQKRIFPCYHWVAAGHTVSCSSSTTLLQAVEDNPILMKYREQQLEERKKQYRWEKMEDLCLPSGIDVSQSGSLPPDEGFDLVKNVSFFGKGGHDMVDSALHGLSYDLNTLHGYEQYAELLGKPDVCVYELSRWTSDVEFGRQILNGVNPVVIRRCESLPAKFPVVNEMVQSSLNRGVTLEQEMKDGHVYICDLDIMDNVPCKDGTYCSAPLCLLYVNAAGELKPIAIQLGQKPGENNPIFLPTDGLVDWIAAKTYYMSSHAQFHQLSSHYLTCHAAMEAYAVALMRNIPDPHPLYKLLRPHVRSTMAINTKARESLLGHKGVIDATFSIGSKGQDEVFRRAGKKYSIHWSNIRRNTEERGVDDSSKLPHYYYRDDGYKIWNVLEEYVHDIIEEFYSNDAAVLQDKELQNFCHDVHVNGFPSSNQDVESGHGFPASISTKAELVEICTLIIFTGSAQHAAVNFGQYTYYGFIPNSPFTLHDPPPTEKGKLTSQQYLKMLPSMIEADITVTLSHLLSSYSPDDVYLGTYPPEQFVEERAKAAIERLQVKLEEITLEIEKRNRELDVPYIYLLPKKIPNSITI